MTKLGVSNNSFGNLNFGSVEIDTESFSLSPTETALNIEQAEEINIEEMDVSSDLVSSEEGKEITQKLSILLNECQIELNDLYSIRDTLNEQFKQTNDIYLKTEIGKKINENNKRISNIRKKYEDKVKYSLLIESINEQIAEVQKENQELIHQQANTSDITAKTEIGKTINTNYERIKEYQMISDIYQELENDTTETTTLLSLLKEKFNFYIKDSNDIYKSQTYFYLYYGELEEQLKNATGANKEKLQAEFDENFDIEKLYEQYNDCKIRIHDEAGSLEELNKELKELELKASYIGVDIADVYRQQKEYEAEQKRIEHERLEAQFERQKKIDEENKNFFMFLWHMYENTDLYKNSFAMGGRLWEHELALSNSKSLDEFIKNYNDTYTDIKTTTLATLTQLPVKAWVGIEKAAEGLIDGCALIGSGVVSLGTFTFEFLNGGMTKSDGFKTTEDIIKNTQNFISKDWIGNAEDWFYSTELGQALDDNALIQHDSAESQFISGLGEAAFNIMTGGAAAGLTGLSAKTAMIATAGLKGIGIGYQNASLDGADAQSAALYASASGGWEMLQWAIGAQINTYAAKGFEAAGTDVAKIIGTLSISTLLDSIDGGIEGFIQPALQMIYKDEDYIKIFEENGGFENVIKQAAIGGFMSLITSIGDAEKAYRTARENGIQIDDINITGITKDQLDIDYQNNLKSATMLKDEILSTIDSGMTDVEKARKLYIELNKRVNYDMNILGKESSDFNDYYNKVSSFSNLIERDNRLVCKGWANLYYELLISSGFDPSKVKIVETPTNSHAWVQINLDDERIMICDATDTQPEGFDISNSKFGKKLVGQVILPKELDGYRLITLKENIKKIEADNWELNNIDDRYELGEYNKKKIDLDVTEELDQLDITEELPIIDETINNNPTEITIEKYNYSELKNNKKDLSKDILSIITDNMNDLEKARVIFKELQKKLNIDATIDTKTWSNLYSDLLLESGIDYRKIKTIVSPKDNHMWVELALDDNTFLKTDITVNSGNNPKSIDGQMITYYSQRSILEEIDFIEQLKTGTNYFSEIDNKIGYKLDLYLEDILSLSTKNKLEAIYEQINGDEIKISLKDINIPETFDGFDFLYYCKNLPDTSYPKLYQFSIGTNEIEPIAWTQQGNDYITYSKSTGKSVFANYDEMMNYFNEIGAKPRNK